MNTRVIETVVQQHTEEAAFLWMQRAAAVRAPYYALRHLARLDERVAAHVDGLGVAGEAGWKLCEAQLAAGEPGEMFAAMVLALEARHAERIETLFALAEAVPAMQPGLVSAFGWVSAQFLQGTVKALLASPSPLRRSAAIACCAMHRVDPGAALEAAARDADPGLRARAYRAAGELARRDLLALCRQGLNDEDPACRFWAAWSAVLLGDRALAVRSLVSLCLTPGAFRERALQLALKVMELGGAHALLKALAQDSASLRWLIQGAGVAGDPVYVPWLIKQMADLRTARVAGESFSFITGLDLAYLDLDRRPPEGFESGPTENSEDENVERDPDEDLPWPDPERIQAWWGANGPRFAQGVRHFMGEPVSALHCEKVLREGYQRQRIAAALYLSLLQPATPLFEWRAPAWRQRRRLA